VTQDRPTLDTVAAQAGVSRMTVSNAYNRPDQLSAATRERVLEVARRLGYPGPDPAGRSLRRRRSGTVGVLLTERLPNAFTDPGLVSFLHGVATELSAAGQAMLLVPGEAHQDSSPVRSAIVDAFVVCSMAASDPAVLAALDRRLPLVTAGHPRLPGVPFVGIDNARAAAKAARHLLELGHRRFAVVALPGRAPASPTDSAVQVRLGMQERLRGFSRALVAAGVPASSLTVAEATANTVEAGQDAGHALLDPVEDRPTAVFAVTDVLALGVLAAAGRQRLTVPDDLSVVGFDDIAEAARSSPALTTVSQSLFEQGRAAAALALGLVAGDQVRSPRMGAELVIRDSTAAPPGAA
jgi:DNA-binding LacI/PurR family transcriptional regulator